LQLDFPSESPYQLLPLLNITAKLKATNNLAVDYYEAGDYKSAQVLEYIVLGLTLLALTLFLLGLFTRKLVAL
jgi:hypothetical protein